MTRPLALIEGDLTIPLPRPYDGLPPPFGPHRDMVREAVQRAAGQTTAPRRPSTFPPGVDHILFYKVLPQRADTGRYDAALAEAKRYLEMGTVRPRSTRSDRLLAASIFAGCTMALTWLLVTCSMKDAEKTKSVQVVPASMTAATGRVQPARLANKAEIGDTQKTAAINDTMPQTVASIRDVASAKPALTAPSSAASANQVAQAGVSSPVVSKDTIQMVPRQTVQLIARDRDVHTASSKKPPMRVKVAQLSNAHVRERVALSRATHPAARPAVSMQPEWSTSASRSRETASTDNAPWLNRPIQQQRPSTRSETLLDNSWNDHMTQRRITDDPAAFHVDRGAQ